MYIIWVVRNYVPSKLCTPYSRNQIPRILETMHPVPLARNHVPGTLETMQFDQKIPRLRHANMVF